jgi:hypothetical protein
VAHGHTAKLNRVVEQLLGSAAPQVAADTPHCQ